MSPALASEYDLSCKKKINLDQLGQILSTYECFIHDTLPFLGLKYFQAEFGN